MFFKKEKTLILGHRGVPLLHQENTMASFRKSIELGIDGIEFDIFKTKDGKIVVFHDKKTARLTGIDKNITQMTWDEIAKLRIQRTIDGVTFPSEERIPLLEEVLDEFKEKLLMNIEIKPSEEKSTGTEVAKVIRRANAEDSVVITSFDPLMLHSLEKEYPALNSGFAYDDKPINDIGKLFKRIPDFFNIYEKFEKAGMNLLTMLLESNAIGSLIKSSVVDIEYTLIDSDTIQKFHKHGILVGAYTLFSNGNHDEAQNQAAQRLIRDKVDWIETDDPERLQQMLHGSDFSPHSSGERWNKQPQPNRRKTIMSKIITSVTEGHWGGWGEVVTAPVGCYINGIRVRYEAPIGSGDDTALNGIEIQYISLPGAANPVKKTIIVHPGHWGDWRSWKYVPDGYYIIGLVARLERPQGGGRRDDDTSLNGIKMICKSFFSDDIKRISVEEGNWGDWSSADVLAPYPGWGVVGLQARVEAPIGNGDDTAMNGIRMACRKLI